MLDMLNTYKNMNVLTFGSNLRGVKVSVYKVIIVSCQQ